MDTSDLDMELVGDSLELLLSCAKLGQSDMNRGSEGGAEVGWAGCDIAEALVMSEASYFFNLGSSNGKSAENCANVSTHLHGDDSQLVLFVNPDEEALGSVVEDSSATRPVTVQSASFQEAISLFEEEVVSNELFLSCFFHAFNRIEGTGEFALKCLASLNDLSHNLFALHL